MVYVAGAGAVAAMSDKSLEEQLRDLAEQVACDSLTRSSIVSYLEALAVQVGELEREPDVFRRQQMMSLVSRNAQWEVQIVELKARIEALEGTLREIEQGADDELYEHAESGWRTTHEWVKHVRKIARAALDPKDTE